MSALVALALLGAAPAQERVELGLNPPLDKALEFAVNLDADGLDGKPLLNARIIIAQRAKRQGANFRLTRYVPSVFVTGVASEPRLIALPQELNGLVGKSFPLLIDSKGRRLPIARGKYDNADDGIPNLVIPAFGTLAIGETRPITGFSLGPRGQVTLRETRGLGDQRVAVFDFLSDKGESEGKGTLVLSIADGLPLLFEISAGIGSAGERPAARLHMFLRRQNVPGIDRLVADLGLNP